MQVYNNRSDYLAYGSPRAMLSMSYYSDRLALCSPPRSDTISAFVLWPLIHSLPLPKLFLHVLLSSPLIPKFASSAQTTFHFRKPRSPGRSFDLSYDLSNLFELLLTPGWQLMAVLDSPWPFLPLEKGLLACIVMRVCGQILRLFSFAITLTSRLTVDFLPYLLLSNLLTRLYSWKYAKLTWLTCCK